MIRSLESTPNNAPPFSPKFAALIEDLRLRNDKGLLSYWQGVALRCGGMEELDYQREHGISFNPRPARVAHILTADCGLWEAPALCAAMLAVLQEHPLGYFLPYARDESVADTEVLELQDEAREALTRGGVRRKARIIGLSCHLDRIRHLHLSPAFRSGQSRAAFLRQTEQFLEMAKRERLPLEPQIAHWLERQRKGY